MIMQEGFRAGFVIGDGSREWVRSSEQRAGICNFISPGFTAKTLRILSFTKRACTLSRLSVT